MAKKALGKPVEHRRARIRRKARSRRDDEGKEATGPFEKKEEDYCVPENPSGFYTRKQIEDTRAILDLHDNWCDKEPRERRKARRKDETVFGVEVKLYGSLEVEEISDLSDALPDKPKKRDTKDLEELVCGFGGHKIDEDAMPVQVRTGKGKSYVCLECEKGVPRDMFMKKLQTPVKELLGEVSQRSMLSLGYVPKKYVKVNEYVTWMGPVLDPLKNLLSGFAVGPYYCVAFCSALARSEKGVSRYTGLYGVGKFAGGLAAMAGVITCAVTALQGHLEGAGLLFTNTLSAGYELTHTKEFDSSIVESPYKSFRDVLFANGYEVARRNHTNKFPYGLVVALENDEQAELIKLQLIDLAAAHKVKPSYNLPEVSKGRPLLSIGLTPLIQKKYYSSQG